MQRLRLVSVQEDLTHQKVHTGALAAECSRRQEECNVTQAQLQAAFAQNEQLESELLQSAAAMANAQVALLSQGVKTLSSVMVQGMCLLWSSISKQGLTPLLCLQAQHATLQAAFQDKEGSLQALQTRLQEAQTKLEALEQSANKAVQAAEQRNAAVEERARLSEQVLNTPVMAGQAKSVITCHAQHRRATQTQCMTSLCCLRSTLLT